MKNKVIFLIVILLVLTIFSIACEDFKVVFEDSGLEQAIREAINKPNGDIYTGELKELKGLNADLSGIKSLRGIEYCTSLKVLSLIKNQISDLSPLAGLTSLEALMLTSNQISDLTPLAALHSLKVLWVGGNQIIDLKPLLSLENLVEVILVNNPLNEESKNIIIPKLRKNGVTVLYE